MDFSRNSRGQYNDVVNKSVDDGAINELIFKEFLEQKYKIELKKKSQYKPYDFSLNKTVKLEYKGLHYSLDTYTNTAESSSKAPIKTITNVLIGNDKIIYYYHRKRRNKNLRFFVFYGFIESSDSVVNKIIYRYIEITDLLYEMIMSFPQQYYYNKEHVLIPISMLKGLNECPLFIL